VLALPVSVATALGTGAAVAGYEADAFFAQLRDRELDLAIQVHGGGRTSNPLVERFAAAWTIGLRAPDAPPLDQWVPYVYWQSEVLRALEVVALVGALPVRLAPALTVLDADRRAAAAALAGDRRDVVVLAPGASDPRRRWPPAGFAALGDRLVEAGWAVVLVGAAEPEITAQVVARMHHPAVDLGGSLTLPALVGLLGGAALFVGNDSGPLHLAEAVGTPTVGIYWCGNLINAGPPFRTRNRVALSWRLDCPVCGVSCISGRCDHRCSFVSDVAVEEVQHIALNLLDAMPAGGMA
jgi:ADP-heptose:LPS heptosyltransferase